MLDFLKLKNEVSETTDSIEPDDVYNVKSKLKNLGYYKEPDWGMTKFTDGGMFEGIKAFQKDNKLKVDGIMKPQGETESKINALQKLKENHKQQENLISPTNSYPQNLKNWIAEKDRVSKMKISDVNKHQYMSCIAGKGGNAMAVTGFLGGIAREADDYRRKLFNKELRDKYNGALGVWMDGSKDMVNNIKGLKKGYWDNNDCKKLLDNK